MGETKENSKDYKSLLEVYSVKEFISIFTNIEDDISELHECSSNDFLGLNNHFKRYFKENKIISGNISKIFEMIRGEGTGDRYESLVYFCRDYEFHLNEYKSFYNFMTRNLESMLATLDLLFLPIKNLKQNLMTLKFLVTNLKLNMMYSERKDNNGFEEYTQNIEKIIDDVKQISPQMEKNLGVLKEHIKEVIQMLNQGKKSNLEKLDSSIEKANSITIYLSDKYKKAEAQVSIVSEKTKSCSKNIGEIITNLQYQDIIRQKMEHIQTAQKDIIEKLKELEEIGSEEEKDEKHLKYYLQIRDISGIQAAQLILANKEYQSAIEIISGSFRAIGDDLTELTNIINGFFEVNLVDASTPLSDIADQLKSVVGFSDKLIRSQKAIHHKIGEFSEEVEMLLKQNSKIFQLNDSLKKLSSNMLDTINNGGEDLANSSKQIKNLSSQINGMTNTMSSLVDKVVYFREQLQERIDRFKKKDIKVSSPEAIDVIHDLQETYSSINNLLVINNELAENIAEDIFYALREVKYYDFFEKIIEKIINELNTVNCKLKTQSNNLDLQDKSENLKEIKGLYTMKSEREVHEKISEHGNVDEFDLFDESKEDQDEDELELF